MLNIAVKWVFCDSHAKTPEPNAMQLGTQEAGDKKICRLLFIMTISQFLIDKATK